MRALRHISATAPALLVFACAALAGCESDDGPACGPVYDHFADDAINCASADSPLQCRDDAEAEGKAWIVHYRQGTIDGGEHVPEYLIGTANEMHLDVAPYAAAKGDHLSQDYALSGCRELELVDGVWLTHECVDATPLCED